MIAKVHGRWAFVSHTHKPLAYWHGSGRPTKKWEAEQERRVEMFKHMDAAENPRSKYKPGDPVVFTHAGPNFQRTATIHTVRKDGALIVHFDDDPPRSILVVQPYEIGPTATTTFAVENPLPEPWDDAAENPVHFYYRGYNVNINSEDQYPAYSALMRAGFTKEQTSKAAVMKVLLQVSNDLPIGAEVKIEKLYRASRGYEPNAKFSSGQSAEEETLRLAEHGSFYDPATGKPKPAKWTRVSRSKRESSVHPWVAFEGGAAENPRGTDDLHARIAAALGWPMRDVQSVSLQSLRDLVRPVDPQLADDISRKVQSGSHLVHTGVEVSPTERQIIDFMLVDAEDIDRGTFSRASTEEIAAHFQITPEVAYKRMNALAKRGVISKSRDIIKGRGGKKVVGWQFWEYAWKPGDEARAEQIEAARRGGAVSNPVEVEHTQDEQCTVGPDGTCITCGVSHTGLCACGGRGFHRPGCPEAEPVVPVTKAGPNGELLRYVVFFRDPGKPAFEPEETWGTWAYSIEHAGDLFREVHEGFQVVRTELEVVASPAENPVSPEFEAAKAKRDRLEAEVKAAGDVLGTFPSGPTGLTPDHVRAMPEWQTAKARYGRVFTALQNFNSVFVSTFAKELRAERDARRGIRENPNPRPKSQGFIVVDTRTGEILSELLKRREAARDAVVAILAEHGRATPAAGDVEYKGGRWYRSLGVHQVMLYPGQTYQRETYKP